MSETRRKSNEEIDTVNAAQDANAIVLHQTKVLSSNVTTDGIITELTFNNLEVGKTYRVGGNILNNFTLDDGVNILIENGSQVIGFIDFNPSAGGGSGRKGWSPNLLFTATATEMTFDATSASANSLISGDGTKAGTFITLEELPNHQETSKWS